MVYVLLLIIALVLLGVPLGYMLGIVSIAGLWDMGGWGFLRIIATRYCTGVETFLLVAIPSFIMAAELMNRSGLTERLINFVNLLLGHYRGGLSHVNIGSSIIFAGMTGAAVTDTVAIGSILIPSMKKEGYDSGYVAAVTAASSIVGPIIPPSITMIVYAHITGLSVGSLFAAGIVPGFLMGGLLLVVSSILSARRNYPRRAQRASLKEILVGGRDAILALIIPIIILGSVLLGVATVTESAAVAVGYAFFIGMFVMRRLKWTDIVSSAANTARLTGVIFLLLATAHTFGWYITRIDVPVKVTNLILSVSTSPIAALIMINIFLLMIGTLIDILPALLILTPVLSPAMSKIGLDPLHFALIMLVNLNIGMITPPYGMCLLTSSRIARVSYDRTIVQVVPFLISQLLTLALLTYIPFLSLYVPGLLGLH